MTVCESYNGLTRLLALGEKKKEKEEKEKEKERKKDITARVRRIEGELNRYVWRREGKKQKEEKEEEEEEEEEGKGREEGVN